MTDTITISLNSMSTTGSPAIGSITLTREEAKRLLDFAFTPDPSRGIGFPDERELGVKAYFHQGNLVLARHAVRALMKHAELQPGEMRPVPLEAVKKTPEQIFGREASGWEELHSAHCSKNNGIVYKNKDSGAVYCSECGSLDKDSKPVPERAGVLPTTDPDYFKELLDAMCMEAVGNHTHGVSAEVRGYQEALDAYEKVRSSLKEAIHERDFLRLSLGEVERERDSIQSKNAELHNALIAAHNKEAHLKADNESARAEAAKRFEELTAARTEQNNLRVERDHLKADCDNKRIMLQRVKESEVFLRARWEETSDLIAKATEALGYKAIVGYQADFLGRVKGLREATDANNKSFWSECPDWLKHASCGTPHVAMKIMVEELEAADQGVLKTRAIFKLPHCPGCGKPVDMTDRLAQRQDKTLWHVECLDREVARGRVITGFPEGVCGTCHAEIGTTTSCGTCAAYRRSKS